MSGTATIEANAARRGGVRNERWQRGATELRGSGAPIYDPIYIQALLDLGDVMRAMNRLDDGQNYYQKILSYDQIRLPSNDRRIARDLNNLGVNGYLKACTESDPAKRVLAMQDANNYFREAAKIYTLDPSYEHSLANVLDSQYLVLRDLGQLEKAKQTRARAQLIEGKFARLSMAP
jgi:hypothetical protein